MSLLKHFDFPNDFPFILIKMKITIREKRILLKWAEKGILEYLRKNDLNNNLILILDF